MSTSAAFPVGTIQIFSGRGPVRVEGEREMQGQRFLVVKSVDGPGGMSIPIDKVEGVLRAPIERSEADAHLATLHAPSGAVDERAWAERQHDYMLTLVRRPFAAQVAMLRALYAVPYALGMGERKTIMMYEDVVVAELAVALGKPRDQLALELHAGQPAFVAGQPPRPPAREVTPPNAPLELAEHAYLGAITAPSGGIIVGDPATRGTAAYAASGKPGTWHAYAKSAASDDGALVLVHADALARYEELRPSLVELASLVVGGGTIAMIAAERSRDAALEEAMIFPVGPILDGSACVVRTRGDGRHALRGAKVDGAIVALVVEF